jgi:hypothetical protein
MEDRVVLCKMVERTVPVGGPHGRSVSSSASALVQRPAASMLDNWLSFSISTTSYIQDDHDDGQDAS